MSGGEFDYAYSHIKDFSENLGEVIKKNGAEEKDGYKRPEYSNETLQNLSMIQIMAYSLYKMSKDAEWLCSDDIGEGEFNKRMSALGLELAAELQKFT